MGRPRKAAEYRLWQHDNRTWYVLWTAPGGTKRLSTRTTDKRLARKWLDQFIAGRETPKPPAQLSITAILDGYLIDRKPRVRAFDTLEWACKALRREMGNLEPAHLSNSVMRKYAKTRQLEGRANGTIIREIVTLRAALKWAKAEDWIADVPPLPMPVSAPPPRDRWLTKDEVRTLLANATAFHIKLFILLALKTAARRGAILDLRWVQVDMKTRRIDYGRGHGNKSRSVVPMDDQLFEAMQTAKELACGEYVMEFNGRRVRSVRTGFDRACERARITDISPHVLRHTAATWAVLDGVPLAEVARLLGDSEKMVEKVYGKHTPNYLKRAVGSLTL